MSKNNKWQWWIWFTGCLFRRAYGLSQLALYSVWRLLCAMLYSSYELLSELSQWLSWWQH